MICPLNISNLITRTLHAPLAELEVSSTRSTSVLVTDDSGVNVGEPSCNTNVPEFQQFKKNMYTLIMSNDNVLHIINYLFFLAERYKDSRKSVIEKLNHNTFILHVSQIKVYTTNPDIICGDTHFIQTFFWKRCGNTNIMTGALPLHPVLKSHFIL